MLVCYFGKNSLNNSGIYKISNSIDDRIYIGSSKSFRARFKKHEFDLAEGRHHSIHMERFCSKYFEDVIFYFEILEITEKDQLINREQYYLDTLLPFGEKGFNMRKKAISSAGTQKVKRSFYQYDKDGNEISFLNIEEMASSTGLNKNTMRGALTGQFKTCGGFIFSYDKLSKEEVNNILADKRKTRYTRPNLNRRVTAISLEHGKHEYETALKASQELGICDISIRKACRKGHYYKGYKWSYS